MKPHTGVVNLHPHVPSNNYVVFVVFNEGSFQPFDCFYTTHTQTHMRTHMQSHEQLESGVMEENINTKVMCSP